jgi:hypothetical protein
MDGCDGCGAASWSHWRIDEFSFTWDEQVHDAKSG